MSEPAERESRARAAGLIVDEVVAVANGKRTKGEILGHHEMLFYLEGVTV